MPYYPPPGVPDPYTPPDGTWNLEGNIELPNARALMGRDGGGTPRNLVLTSGNDSFFGYGTVGTLYIGQGNALVGNLETIEGFTVTCRWREGMTADIASAAALTFGLNGNSADITGVTQIDTIDTGTWDEGNWIRCFFTGILTLNHNNGGAGGAGAMVLSGSINAATIAGCSFIFELRGDPTDANALKWFEMGRRY